MIEQNSTIYWINLMPVHEGDVYWLHHDALDDQPRHVPCRGDATAIPAM
jgi:hypothetical protein